MLPSLNPSVLLLWHKPTLTLAFRFAHRFPCGNGLDLAGAGRLR